MPAAALIALSDVESCARSGVIAAYPSCGAPLDMSPPLGEKNAVIEFSIEPLGSVMCESWIFIVTVWTGGGVDDAELDADDGPAGGSTLLDEELPSSDAPPAGALGAADDELLLDEETPPSFAELLRTSLLAALLDETPSSPMALLSSSRDELEISSSLALLEELLPAKLLDPSSGTSSLGASGLPDELLPSPLSITPSGELLLDELLELAPLTYTSNCTLLGACVPSPANIAVME